MLLGNFDLDCKVVVDKLNRVETDFSELGSIIFQCKLVFNPCTYARIVQLDASTFDNILKL